MFVDIHAHAYRRQPVYGTVKRRWAMPETLLRFYDKYNVEKGVLLPVVSPECNAIQSNEDILEAAERYPGRFIPFCNVDPRAINNTPHAPLELHLEQYKEAGCKGLGEVMANYSFYDPMMQNLFRAAHGNVKQSTFSHISSAFSSVGRVRSWLQWGSESPG